MSKEENKSDIFAKSTEMEVEVGDDPLFDSVPDQPHQMADTTLVETQATHPITRSGGEGRNELVRIFQEIIRQQAIYYPVCYRFQRELGRGRQGVVTMCLRQGARGCLTKHAIKLFDPSIYSSSTKYWTDMGRIASQVSIMQTMRSPNLISMDTYDEVNGVGYIQMEVVNGVDLRYLLNGNHLKLAKAISTADEWKSFTRTIFRISDDGSHMSIQPGIAIYILRMMLRGLEILHDVGFVHSDIKPSNVMINRLGHVKLIDYGRAGKPNEPLRILLGSPLYMAPETHLRQPTVNQSDLYSVGIVALELLRGKPLVTGSKFTEKELLELKMDLPNQLNDLLPRHVVENEEFVQVLRKLIDPDPAKRFVDARSAEMDEEGLRIVHKQLMKVGHDADYLRELAAYMAKVTKLRKF